MGYAVAWRVLVECVQEELSDDVRWVGYIAATAFGVLALFGAHVSLQLGT